MTSQVIVFTVLLASPIAILFCHMLCSRILNKRMPAQSIAVFSIVLAGMLVLILNIYLSGADALIYGLIVYVCLGYSYFHIFNMSETARRIRILYEIYTRPGINIEQLKASYGPQDMLRVRLERLVDTGQLACLDGRYVLKAKILYYAARFILCWRALLGFPPSYTS